MQLNFKNWLISDAVDIGPLDQKGKQYLTALVGAIAKNCGDEIAARTGQKPQTNPPAPGVASKSVKDQAAALSNELLNKLTGPLGAAVTGAIKGAMTTKPTGSK